jgi:molybdopterin-guanine dinucleotide biosynthesis protein A
MKTIAAAQITGLILAGGRGRRMGGADKGLTPLNGRPLISHAIERLSGQAGSLIVSANRHIEDYRAFGWPVVEDRSPDFAGPLAGIAAGMARSATPYLLAAPCDAPLLPMDLAARLGRALVAQQADIAAAHDGERLQPLCALLACGLLPSLLSYLAGGGHKVMEFYQRQRCAQVDFSDQAGAFVNLNAPDDCRALEYSLKIRNCT